MMDNKKPIPMIMPNIGGNQQRPLDITEAIPKTCSVCGSELFTSALRLMMVPRIAPSNPTGQDVLVKVEVFLCRSCGVEFGRGQGGGK